MKQLIFLFTLMSAGTIAQCQLNKGVWLVGGSGSIYSYHEDYAAPSSVAYSGKYTNIDLSPSIGYFFTNKFTGGLRPYLNLYKGKVAGSEVADDLKLALGPFLRYYFLEKDKQFNLLADVSYQIGTNKARNAEYPKGRYNIFSIMTGVEAFFNSSVGLEILVGYKNQIATFDDSPSAYSSKRSGIQTSIGFQFHLEKIK